MFTHQHSADPILQVFLYLCWYTSLQVHTTADTPLCLPLITKVDTKPPSLFCSVHLRQRNKRIVSDQYPAPNLQKCDQCNVLKYTHSGSVNLHGNGRVRSRVSRASGQVPRLCPWVGDWATRPARLTWGIFGKLRDPWPTFTNKLRESARTICRGIKNQKYWWAKRCAPAPR